MNRVLAKLNNIVEHRVEAALEAKKSGLYLENKRGLLGKIRRRRRRQEKELQ